jgi:hypothetical protein
LPFFFAAMTSSPQELNDTLNPIIQGRAMQTNTPFWRAVQLSGASLQPELIDRQQDLEHYQAHDVPLDTQRIPGADQVDNRALGASDQFKLAVEAARRSWISNSSSSSALRPSSSR